MTERVAKVCSEVTRILVEKSEEDAMDYCQKEIESEVNIETEKYDDLKLKAMNEKEVWGDKSEIWIKILPTAAGEKEDMSEWRFVIGNFLISSVMECNTTGNVCDDIIISKTAHEMFEKRRNSTRQEMLSLAIYHQKMAQATMNKEDNHEKAIEHLQNSLNIIKQTNLLGGWHHNALILRDKSRFECDQLETKGNLVEAASHAQSAAEKVRSINAPTSEKFYHQLKGREHKIRSQITSKIDNPDSRRYHLRKCSDHYKKGGKKGLSRKYATKERDGN